MCSGHVVAQGVDDIFLAQFAGGVEHGDEDDEEHAEGAGGHTG